MIEQIYLKISALYPKSTLASTRLLLLQSGLGAVSARTYLGFATFFTFVVSLIALLIAPVLTKELWIIISAPIAAGLSAAALFYLYLTMGADSRAKQIETLLPDGLQLISSNMRAGMTLENAVWSSAVPEFGPLRDEIRKVSADTFAGKSIEQSLRAMGTRVRSNIVDRTIKLIAEGIHLGGEMAPLLEEVSDDIRSTQNLQKEIETSTTMYALFIVFAAVIAAPVLFSVSSFYSQMNEDITSKQAASFKGGNLPSAAGVPSIGLGSRGSQGEKITAAEIQSFSLGAITLTTFFAGLILGQIRTGNWANGLKYSPIFVIVALTLYSLGTAVLSATLGNLI